MPTIEMNYEQAHEFVNKNSNNNFFWDGYTIVKWTPGHNGFLQVNGMFKNNKWGYASRYNMTKQGTWKISDKYARFI